MKVEFINFNDDPLLDPEIKKKALSMDSKNKPPSYCMPWVEATRYSIQLKANFEYWIRKSQDQIEACAVQDGKAIPVPEIYASVPEGISYNAKDETEKKERKLSVGHTPAFSSLWQSKTGHSVTLKLGIGWWTSPGWGMFFTSAVHRNENFRIVEGFVRTDLWHRDIPILVQPIEKDIKIPKYSVLASAVLMSAEDLELSPAQDREQKITELAYQTSFKRINPSYYKILLASKDKKKD